LGVRMVTRSRDVSSEQGLIFEATQEFACSA
jgi:hypothetical protein